MNQLLVPIRAEIQTHLHVCFSYLDGFIPARSFPEKGTSHNDSASNIWFEIDEYMAARATEFAISASKHKAGCYIIPGVVKNVGEARSRVVVQMQALLIDIDTGITASKWMNCKTYASSQELVKIII